MESLRRARVCGCVCVVGGRSVGSAAVVAVGVVVDRVWVHQREMTSEMTAVGVVAWRGLFSRPTCMFLSMPTTLCWVGGGVCARYASLFEVSCDLKVVTRGADFAIGEGQACVGWDTVFTAQGAEVDIGDGHFSQDVGGDKLRNLWGECLE